MDKAPVLQVNSLPTVSEDANAPARGKEMRANLLQKLRPPPLVHLWDFWHDRQDRSKAGPGETSSTAADGRLRSQSRDESAVSSSEDVNYEDRLVKLCTITDVREFWEVFNNFDIGKLPLRDSVHLFHKGVKPLWEDPRNTRGGAWTFRVPKEKARDFWKEICMMAIGEQLQEAVASKRITFIDDICGVSYSVRFTSTLITIWNRDGDHAAGIEKILQVILKGLPAELVPKESSYYYKKHSEHSGFKAPEGGASPRKDSEVGGPKGMGAMDSVAEEKE